MAVNLPRHHATDEVNDDECPRPRRATSSSRAASVFSGKTAAASKLWECFRASPAGLPASEWNHPSRCIPLCLSFVAFFCCFCYSLSLPLPDEFTPNVKKYIYRLSTNSGGMIKNPLKSLELQPSATLPEISPLWCHKGYWHHLYISVTNPSQMLAPPSHWTPSGHVGDLTKHQTPAGGCKQRAEFVTSFFFSPGVFTMRQLHRIW